MTMLTTTLTKRGNNPATELGRSRDCRPSAAVFFLAVIALSALAQLSPEVLAGMQFDRSAIDGGQWWRLLTGNLVHYDGLHLGANLGAFALLGWIALGRARGAGYVVALSALAVGVGVYTWADGVTTYRGISGVVSALLAWMLVVMALDDRGWKAVGWSTILLLIIAKSVYETIAGVVLFPTSAPQGVVVVNVTHIIGLATGAVLGMSVHLGPMRRPCPIQLTNGQAQQRQDTPLPNAAAARANKPPQQR